MLSADACAVNRPAEAGSDEGRERLRILVDGITEYAVYMLDVEGRITTWNAGASLIKGYTAEEVLGRHFSIFFTESALQSDKPRLLLEAARTTGRFAGEGWRIRRDGLPFWAGIVINPLNDAAGNHVGYAKITRDLTQIRIENEQRRILFEAAPNAMLILDEDGRIDLVNSALETLFEYGAAHLIGQPIDFLIQGGLHQPAGQAVGRRSDGGEIALEIMVNAIETPRGHITVACLVDVGIRLRTESLLRAEAQRYQALLSTATEGICVLDRHGLVRETSDRFLGMLGYRRDERPALRLPDWVGVARQQEPSTMTPVTRRVRRCDGTEFDAELSMRPVVIDGETLLYTAVRDISERLRGESALRESEARFRGAFETAAHGMALVAPDGPFLMVNRALCEMIGYDETALLATDFQSLTHPDDLQADLGHVRDVLSGAIGAYQMEKRYLHASGKVVWVLLAVSLVRSETGQPLYFVAQVENITRQKAAALALQESEAQFRAVAETARDGIISTDEMGRIVYVNPAAGAIFGHEAAALIGREIGLLIHRTEAPGLRAASEAPRWSSGIEGGTREVTGCRSDGSLFPMEMSIAEWEASDQRFVTAIVRDVSARHRDQRRLKETLDEKETLLREVYHRVKNNLQVIQSLFRINGRAMPSGPAREAMIEAGGRVRAMALVHEKLYQSKNLSHIGLAEYASDLLHQIEASNGLHQRRIRIKLDVADLDAELDTAIPLGLLINELVANSIKHGFPGERGGEISIKLETSAFGARLSVSDDGIGLPDGLQVDRVTSMGLSVATTLAAQLRGKLQIESRKPACFSVEFSRLLLPCSTGSIDKAH